MTAPEPCDAGFGPRGDHDPPGAPPLPPDSTPAIVGGDAFRTPRHCSGMERDTDPLLTCAQLEALGRRQAELLRRMEADLGADAMHRFVRACGGQYICLSAAMDLERSDVAQRAGVDVAAWLREHIGSGNICAPSGPNSPRNRALARVVRILAAGGSHHDAVRATGLHVREIEYLQKRWRDKGVDISTFAAGSGS